MVFLLQNDFSVYLKIWFLPLIGIHIFQLISICLSKILNWYKKKLKFWSLRFDDMTIDCFFLSPFVDELTKRKRDNWVFICIYACLYLVYAYIVYWLFPNPFWCMTKKGRSIGGFMFWFHVLYMFMFCTCLSYICRFHVLYMFIYVYVFMFCTCLSHICRFHILCMFIYVNVFIFYTW